MAPPPKVSPLDVKRMREAFASGRTVQQIAVDYGLSPDWTRRICLGEVYRDGPRPRIRLVPRRRTIPEPGRLLLLGLAQAELQRCHTDADRTRPRAVMSLIRALREDGGRLSIEWMEPVADLDPETQDAPAMAET